MIYIFIGIYITRCFSSDEEYLKQTSITQPALLVAEYSAYKVLMDQLSIKPYFLAGHSLGEITSLLCAEAILFEDALRIVKRRGELMQEASSNGKGGMIAITNADSSMVHYYCKIVKENGKNIYVSNYNTSNQTVVSGEIEGLNELETIICQNGANVTWLKVSAPFHCELMAPAAIELQKLLNNYEYQDIKIPVLSNVNALPYTNKYSIVDNLTEQMTMPVQWNQIMYFLEAQDINIIIDIGPKQILRNMLRRSFPGSEGYAVDKNDDREELKLRLNNRQMNRMLFLHRCMAITVCTPNANWNLEEYQSKVVKPYNEIKA